MPQVSVIVLTYNPDPAQLRRTLASIAAQREIEYELIVSDDGSKEKDFSFLESYLSSLGIQDWILLDNARNQGTVINTLSAVRQAKGEFVFLTSPGDFLFDRTVLRDFYRFAKERKASTCFGNAVFYGVDTDGSARQTQPYTLPTRPQLYAPGASRKRLKTCLFGGEFILGAAFFRERTRFCRHLESISGIVTYLEDTATSMTTLAEGYRIVYYDRNIVFYEDGSGISSAKEAAWKETLRDDLRLCLHILERKHQEDPYLDFAHMNISIERRASRLIQKLVFHPVLFIRLCVYRLYPKKRVSFTKADRERLNKLLRIG